MKYHYFSIFFLKSIDKLKRMLYDGKNFKEECQIKLIDYFFILLIINSFIFFYSLYIFFDIKVFHNLQGSKLHIKSQFFDKR